MAQGALPHHLQRRLRPIHDNANSGAHPSLLQLNQTGQNLNLTTLIWHYNPQLPRGGGPKFVLIRWRQTLMCTRVNFVVNCPRTALQAVSE